MDFLRPFFEVTLYSNFFLNFLFSSWRKDDRFLPLISTQLLVSKLVMLLPSGHTNKVIEFHFQDNVILRTYDLK